MSAVNWAAVSAKATARISSTTTTIRRPSGSTVGSVVPLVVSVVVSVVSPAATDDAGAWVDVLVSLTGSAAEHALTTSAAATTMAAARFIGRSVSVFWTHE